MADSSRLVSAMPDKPNADFTGKPPPPEVEQVRCSNPTCGVFIGHNYTREEREPQQCSDCLRLDDKLAPLQSMQADLYRMLQRIESRVLEMREEMRARESGVRVQRPMAGGR